MYVCICRAVTTQTILDLAAAGVRSTNEVGERCGAGTVCAKCRPTIRTLLLSAMLDADDGPVLRDDPPMTASGGG